MNTQLARIQLANPVTIYLAVWGGDRPRIVAGADPTPYGPENGEAHVITYLDAEFSINVVTRTVHAALAPIPRPLQIYGAEDFARIAADTPEQHVERVLQLLGKDPAAVLQALIDGRELPARAPRVPREVDNWRARAVLESLGLLPQVDALITALEGPHAVVVRNAWKGAAPLQRRGPTVKALAASLNLSEEQLDAMFIQADALSY